MDNKALPPEQRSGNRGGKFLPALCTFVGTLLILAVIITCLPLTIPRYMGYEIYNVVSGSMEPEIPVGSVVYVGEVSPAEIQPGEVIAFQDDGAIVTHRVMENRVVEGQFITKGDANDREDLEPVPYAALVGRVARHYPVVGRLMTVYASAVGKVYLLLTAACGVMFNILAGRMRERRKEPSPTAERAETFGAVEAAEPKHSAPKRRLRWVRPLVMTVLAAIFLGSGGVILFVMHQYNVSDRLYDAAAAKFTTVTEVIPAAADPVAEPEYVYDVDHRTARLLEVAPIQVDFDALTAVNSDVVGWIYCEDSIISYPVLQGADDDLYLHHTYEGEYSVSGSIFVEADNRPDFEDRNTIIYGHHMRNGSMFAALENWADQSYYEDHPVMWLLTPEQDYKILLVSGYHTSAYSDTYTIFPEPGAELSAYLAAAMGKSDFTADVDLDGDGHFVVLSTCAYVFDNARYVIHGLLVPVDSAGGVRVIE